MNGYGFRLEIGTLMISKSGKLNMIGKRVNRIYVFNAITIIGSLHVGCTSIDKTLLFHSRLGHVSEKELHELSK